jgi:lysophospholipase L1-like esterase
MIRIIKIALIVALISLIASAQTKNASDSPLQRLQFLIGEWHASADTQLGAGQGAFSFRQEFNGRIVERRNFAEYTTGKAAGTRHDDLMIIYVDSPAAKPQAIYFDSEGHVIRYSISFPTENAAVFESDASQPGPRYRLSYVLVGNTLNGKFEIAPPNQEFKTYLEWKSQRTGEHWIGTWGAAPQSSTKSRVQTYHNQTLRLIVHTSVGGKRARVRISNVFGERPLTIGSAHIARRATDANINPASDRTLTFQGKKSATIPARGMMVSDPVDFEIPALSDLAISVFFPESAEAMTYHSLAKQTNYISAETGDCTAAVSFPVGKTIVSWPFLTGVDVTTSSRGATIVAFGSSTTDGDGSTKDTNRRWPDLLAERLQRAGYTELGLLNEGIIGNRLLIDFWGPHQTGGPQPLGPVFDQLGPVLGQSGLARFDRDVLQQPGVKYVMLALGVNDILFPGAFTPASETVTTQSLIDGNRQLIKRAHKYGIKVIGTTIPPFEHAIFTDPFFDRFYSPEKDKIRQELNDWILHSGELDGVADLERVVRDPNEPAEILPAFDSSDHLHVNDAGNAAQANAIPLELFKR